MSLFYFIVEMPGTGMAMTWMGGGLKPSKTPGKVWLTGPAGNPLLEVEQKHVYPSSREDMERRLRDEAMLKRSPLN